MTDTAAPQTAPPIPRKMPWGKFAFALILVAIATIVMVSTFGIRVTKVDDGFGPRLLPQVLAALIGFGGVVGFVQALLQYRRGDDTKPRSMVPLAEGELAAELAQIVEEKPAKIGPVPVAAAIVAFLLVYVGLIPLLGFHIATAIFCVGALLICGVRKLTTLILFPIGTLLFLYLVFEQLLSVRFP